MKAVWDQSDRKTRAFGKPASRGQAPGVTAGARFQTGHAQAQLVGSVWTRLPGRGAGPQGSGPRLGVLLAAHSSVNKMDRIHWPILSRKPTFACGSWILKNFSLPPTCQATKIHLNASWFLCVFIHSEQGTKNRKLTKAWEIKYLNSTHVCRITEFLYFHGPQNVLEWPQVSQEESPYRLLMRVWIL